jgi:hypothetical protein
MTDQPTTITDEMPDTWVRSVADAIEAHGWTIRDAHESAIVINLNHTAHQILNADDQPFLVIGWTGDGEDEGAVQWGLSVDGVTVPDLHLLGGATPGEVADRAHRVLTTGRPAPRDVRHALPYTAVSRSCVCPVVYPCGGIVPDAECGEHGVRRSPVMGWHWEADCPPVSR